ncbi:MAG: MipA/OmpV family protein [Gammaproteobacteria bacterium]
MQTSVNAHRLLRTWLLFSLTVLMSLPAVANLNVNDPWGIAMGFRIARIPYPASDKQVSDVIPLLFFDNKYVFLRGLTGGIKVYNRDEWQFSLIGRYRYFDIPAGYQNEIRGNGLDIGLQGKYRFSPELQSNLELLSDDEGRFHANIDARYAWDSGSWELLPYASLRWKSSEFNDRYFGLDGFNDPDNPGTTFVNPIGDGWDLSLGSEARYHVISNLYLVGRAQITTLLDSSTRNSASIDRETFGEVYLGVAFFDDKTKVRKPSLDAKPYWRFAYGWATPSNMGDILLRWDVEDDPQNNQMASVFYGHPVFDSLFGVESLDVYITPGFVYHRASDPFTDPDSGITYDSQPTTEYVLALKLYWNLEWPIRWRLGGAEGVSYVKDITNLEQREMDNKGYRASNLMNFIDVSIDLNVGDLFNADSVRDLWFGYSLHHRSSIFETSSAFGRIKGGSNYNTLYLQYHW